MIYNCNNQPIGILRGTSAIAGGNLTITLPNVGTLENGDILRFFMVGPIDYTNPLGTVNITINGTTFPLKTRFGNDLRIQQLVARRVYTVGLGAQTPNFTMLSAIPESSYDFPTYPAAN